MVEKGFFEQSRFFYSPNKIFCKYHLKPIELNLLKPPHNSIFINHRLSQTKSQTSFSDRKYIIVLILKKKETEVGV